MMKKKIILILLSAKTQIYIKYLSAMPINRHFGLFFQKVSPS